MRFNLPTKNLVLGLALLVAAAPTAGCAVESSDLGERADEAVVVSDAGDVVAAAVPGYSGELTASQAQDNTMQLPASEPVAMRSAVALDCSAGSAYRAAVACTPAVMVVRHAEDTASGPHALTEAGENHADLYVSLVDEYVFGKAHGLGPAGADVCVCPVAKVVAIDPESNAVSSSPSSNPFETIRPLANALALPIAVADEAGTPYTSCYNWNTAARQALLRDADGAAASTVVAWDKQGLNWTAADAANLTDWCKLSPSAEPLLKKLAKSFTLEADGSHFTPQRDHFFVFAGQDEADGKFTTFKTYQQTYSHDGAGWYTTSFLTDAPKFVDVAKL